MKLNSLINTLVLSGALTTASSAAIAQDLTLTLTNLTQGIYFTPLIAVAHDSDNNLFSVASVASSELQAMAEGGDIAGLSAMASNAGSNIVSNPAGGLLAPAMSTSFTLSNDTGNDFLSVAAMVLPSNDGFVGLDSWAIPQQAGTYTLYLNAYDAGTEANNERVVEGSGAPGVAGIPAAPGGNAGTGGSGITDSEDNMKIHIHRGNLGDDDLTSGNSDLNNTVHRWLNPVAKITVVVM
jgi:hypothetical protein